MAAETRNDDAETRPATWLEVALNGPWGPDKQPAAPVAEADIVAEGIACAETGAAILHVHAFDPETGRQDDSWERYARIIEGIRAETDAIVYPTVPFNGAADHAGGQSAAERYAHIAELGRRGLIEMAVVDPGSVRIADFEAIRRDAPGFLYDNPDDHVREGLRLAAEHGFHPGYAVYEPGFLRYGAALAARYPQAPVPVYRFMFSDRFAFGFPPRPYALDAYRMLLAETLATPAIAGEAARADAPWMIAGLQVDVSPLIAATVAAGGHVRVGLEDAPLGESRSNPALAEAAAQAIDAAGGRLATAAEVRRALAGG